MSVNGRGATFGEFYRVQTPDRQGTHHGEIWADPEGPGHGSRFHFTLPVAEPAEAA